MTDIKELMDLHKLCFGDSDAYTNFFFGIRYKPENTFIHKEEGKVASVVYARMVNISIAGKVQEVPFLTGIATHPDFRYKGYAKQLIAEAIGYYKCLKYPFVLLHPFKVSFYENLGFAPINFYKELEISYDKKGSVIPSADYGTEELLQQMLTQYNKVCATQYAHLVRDEYYYTEMLYEHCVDGGSGAILLDNGNPKGYLLSFAENLREVICTDNSTINSVPELEGLKLKLLDTEGMPYSMAHVADISALLNYVPYNSVTATLSIAVDEQCYSLSIKDGKLDKLTACTSNESTIKMNKSQFMGICLGCGYRYNDTKLRPFIALFPKYNIFAYEQY